MNLRLVLLLLLLRHAASQPSLPVLLIGRVSAPGDNYQESEDAITLAIQVINLKGGLMVNGTSYLVSQVAYGPVADSLVQAILYQRLVQVDGVDALMAPFSGPCASAALSAFTYQLPLLVASQDDSCRVPNVSLVPLHWSFFLLPDTSTFAASCLGVFKSNGVQEVAAVWSGYTQEPDALLSNAASLGLSTIAYNVSEITGDGSQLEEVLTATSEVPVWMGMFGGPNTTALANLGLRYTGYNPLAFFFWPAAASMSWRTFVGWGAQLLFVSSPWDSSLKFYDPLLGSSSSFAAVFNRTYGYWPTATTGFAAGGLVSLLLSFEQAGSLAPDAVQQALANFVGVTILGPTDLRMNVDRLPYYCFQSGYDEAELVPVGSGAPNAGQVIWPAQVPPPPGFLPPGPTSVTAFLGVLFALVGLMILACIVFIVLKILSHWYSLRWIPKHEAGSRLIGTGAY